MAKRNSTSRRSRHPYSDYRRLTPAENERQGRSRTARHYVLKTAQKVNSRTPSITAHAYETIRARQVHGLSSLEQATAMRREGGISYSSADQARRVEKAADRRFVKKAQDSVGKYIPTSNPRRRRTRIHFTEERMT
jgi:hypothetical protein